MPAYPSTGRPNFNPGDGEFFDTTTARVLKPHPTTAQAVDRVVRTMTAVGSANVTDEVILADTTGGAFLITLPLAANMPIGATIRVVKIDAAANAPTVGRAGSDTINGGSSAISLTTTQWTTKVFQVISATGWISF